MRESHFRSHWARWRGPILRYCSNASLADSTAPGTSSTVLVGQLAQAAPVPGSVQLDLDSGRYACRGSYRVLRSGRLSLLEPSCFRRRNRSAGDPGCPAEAISSTSSTGVYRTSLRQTAGRTHGKRQLILGHGDGDKKVEDDKRGQERIKEKRIEREGEGEVKICDNPAWDSTEGELLVALFGVKAVHPWIDRITRSFIINPYDCPGQSLGHVQPCLPYTHKHCTIRIESQQMTHLQGHRNPADSRSPRNRSGSAPQCVRDTPGEC